MSLCFYAAAMMKFILMLFAVLAVIGLGQAHQFPDFGSGPLHEDIQDFLDLIPTEDIYRITLDYASEDSEVQEFLNFMLTSTILKDLILDMGAIPEVINLLNYLQNNNINIYDIINKIKEIIGIDKLSFRPHLYPAIMERTGGVAGLYKDIAEVLPIDKLIHTYAQKLKTSSAFSDLIKQLKSDNFQQLVNKLYKSTSYLTIVNKLKSYGVNTQITVDIMYIVLGITVPNGVSIYQERSLDEEFDDFVKLIPIDEATNIVMKYVIEDEKLQNALLYIFTPEFHSILREIEALKEHDALVVYLEKAGLHVISYIQLLHETIGMEDYIPPKIDSIFDSQIGMLKIGDGMKGLIEDLYNILPIDEIDALYKEKLQNSKVFADFIAKLKAPEMQNLIYNLYGNQTFKNFVMITREKGLEFQELTKLITRIFGLKFPYYM